ncbi:MAG: sensor domain-containing diguanylate cyclase [Pseudomonadota bacterium]|nr:sensor domain-containing diguanylate cyclase [Pseudomonadota bacterium]
MMKPDTPADEHRRLETLYSLNILDTPPEERFDRLTRLAMRLFNVPVAQVSLIDETRQWFKSCLGIDPVEVPRDLTFCGHAILSDGPFVIEDATRDERFLDNPLIVLQPKVRFYAGYPLEVNGRKIGTLCILDYAPRKFSDSDQVLLEDLAYLAQQELTAVHLATMDELTDLTNRRGFYVLANKALKICAQNDIPATLIYLDLNDFKSINDKYGHAEGDKTLAAFAAFMKDSLRDTDILARIGGDEFVALLTGIEGNETGEILERLELSISQHNQETVDEYDIMYSTGVVTFRPEKNQSIDELLAEADALMYKQKARSLQPAADTLVEN